MTLLRRYRYVNTSRLRRETRLQRWIHRNTLASLCLCGSLFRNSCVSPITNRQLLETLHERAASPRVGRKGRIRAASCR
ncbi:hypothetical protein [Nostoc sp.]